METALQSYLETALWTSTDDNDVPLDSICTIYDFAEKSLKQSKTDLDQFTVKALPLLSDHDPNQNLEHDFWLTRNGHGAGFWDGDYVNGDELTTLANQFKPVDVVIGDDGKLYID